jgi:integrase
MFGKLRIARLRKKHVRAWVKAKGYNPTSASKAIGALMRAFNWAVEEEHIPRNPIAHVKTRKALTRDRTLTPDERQLILSKIRGPAFRRFVDALTLTGCRPGEAARVTAADVDLDAGVCVLRTHKTASKRLRLLASSSADAPAAVRAVRADAKMRAGGTSWTCPGSGADFGGGHRRAATRRMPHTPRVGQVFPTDCSPRGRTNVELTRRGGRGGMDYLPP